MTKPTRTVLSAVVVSLLSTLATVSTVWAGLELDVETAIRTSGVEGATVAVSIRDAGGSRLVGILDEQRMIPASNMKLFTTGAALHVLGADFEFVTRLTRHGDRLVVTGDGDPAFGDPELLEVMHLGGQAGIDVDDFLDIWVGAVLDSGPRRVEEIVVDDRIFDRELIHGTWPADQLNRPYCAEVCGLNFHLNVVHFFPKPMPGSGPHISTYRPRGPGIELANRATSDVGPDARPTVWVARKARTNEMTFYGNVRHAYTSALAVTVHDMPAYFAGTLARRIDAAGIPVDRFRLAEPGDTFTDGEPVGPRITTPISTIVTRCNRDSENLYAESLIKRIGYQVTGEPGSWINGSAVVRHVVHERLASPAMTAQIVIADGSGLSRGNGVTASLATAWLESFSRDEKLGDVFIKSLAVGGENGTLKKRFKGVPMHGATVQGKSGFINGVVCLSGYITAPDGRRRTFSILANDVGPADYGRAKKMADQIVSLVAADMVPSSVTLGSDD